MLLRRGLATLTVAVLAGMVGCADGSAPASGPSGPASSSAEARAGTATYVALGDSYTAAPGVPQTETKTGCFRSSDNYPSLVAEQLGVVVGDVSCSGATSRDLAGPQQGGQRNQPPQLSVLSPDTTLVTLGIGGNDFGLFTTLIRTCTQLGPSDPTGSPCRDRVGGETTDPLVEDTSRIGVRVAASVEAIQRQAPQARVVVVGYPQPVPARGTCSVLPLAAGDYPYVRSVVSDLNGALRTAAAAGGATFVDVEKASAGHDICAGPDAWVNGSQTDLTRAVAFHPFAAEQQAVADLIVAALG
jgi:lysophospholipase L1-like esterase